VPRLETRIDKLDLDARTSHETMKSRRLGRRATAAYTERDQGIVLSRLRDRKRKKGLTEPRRDRVPLTSRSDVPGDRNGGLRSRNAVAL